MWISIDPDGLDHFPRWQAVEAHVGDLGPQHTEQGVSQTVRNLSRFSASPDGRKGGESDQTLHTMAQMRDLFD